MADFEKAVAIVLEHEGSSRAADGSIYGIGKNTLRMHTEWGEDRINLFLSTLTENQAACIYKKFYWSSFFENIEDQLICNKIFDLSVVMGLGSATAVAQQAINSVFEAKIVEDGVPGPVTVGYLNLVEGNAELQEKLMCAICLYAMDRMKHVSQASAHNAQFAKGWNARALWPYALSEIIGQVKDA